MHQDYQSIRFSREDFLSFRVPLPHTERLALLEFCALDDKIDLNRRMNETLEAMARAIFKDWFVDFGPTRAKAEGHRPTLPRNSGPSFQNAR